MNRAASLSWIGLGVLLSGCQPVGAPNASGPVQLIVASDAAVETPAEPAPVQLQTAVPAVLPAPIPQVEEARIAEDGQMILVQRGVEAPAVVVEAPIPQPVAIPESSPIPLESTETKAPISVWSGHLVPEPENPVLETHAEVDSQEGLADSTGIEITESDVAVAAGRISSLLSPSSGYRISERSQIENGEVVRVVQPLRPYEEEDTASGYSVLGRNFLVDQEEQEKADPVVIPTLSKLDRWQISRVWKIKPGDTLVDILQLWSDQSGWQFVVETDQDWTFRAGAEFTGNYLEVTSELLRIMQKAKPSPPKGFARLRNLVMILDDDLGRSE